MFVSLTSSKKPSISIDMTGQVDGELFDQVCEQARNEKTAEQITWRQYFERIHWNNLYQFTFFHVGFFYALITYALGLHETPVKWATLAWSKFYTFLFFFFSPNLNFHLESPNKGFPDFFFFLSRNLLNEHKIFKMTNSVYRGIRNRLGNNSRSPSSLDPSCLQG